MLLLLLLLPCWYFACSDSHVKGLYYTLRCFMMDLWEHAQGECAASSDTELQTKLELTSLQVRHSGYCRREQSVDVLFLKQHRQ
jgi:hypothetical protein